MFQTEPILFLQSFASGFLTGLFKFFTILGRPEYFSILILAILFGFSIRKGYMLVYVVIWTGMLTNFFKNLFALPRPANVDSRVILPGKDSPNPTHFYQKGAKTFFGSLPRDVVAEFRLNPFDSWGFPSGHASTAVALWGSIFHFFRKTWIRGVSILFLLMIPLSRVYLGRHFPADVFGGLLLGFLLLFLGSRLIFRNQALIDFLFDKKNRFGMDLRSFLFWFHFLILPAVLPFIPRMDIETSASFLGFNLSFISMRFRGFPSDSGTLLKRIVRFLIALAVFFALRYLTEQAIDSLQLPDTGIFAFLLNSISIFLSIRGAFEISIQLKLFQCLK